MIRGKDRIKEILASLVLRDNYWGYLFSKVDKVEIPDAPWPMAVGVNPNKGTLILMYNSKKIENTGNKEIRFILEHEGVHILCNHIPRLIKIIADEITLGRKAMKIKVWNVAADCCDNFIMKMPDELKIDNEQFELCHAHKYRKGLPPKNGNPGIPPMPTMEDDKTADFYYIELLKVAEKQKKNCCNSQEEIFFEVIGEDGEDGEDGKKIFSNHDKWKEAAEKVSDVSSLARKVERNAKMVVRESIRHFKNRGKLPGHIREMIDVLLKPPEIPYYSMIRKLVRGSRLSKFTRSPTRINRKRTYLFATSNMENMPDISPFPGRKMDYTFNIGLLLDTSGSMSNDEIALGLSGCKHLIEKDRDVHLTVVECDAEVGREYVCKKIRDIQFTPTGGGGTVLYPGLKRLKELNVDVVLAFTDGGCENINNISRHLLPKKIIWVITSNYGSSDSCVNKTGYVVHATKPNRE